MDASPATEASPKSRLDRALAAVPVVLSSKPHILWLFVLLLWIVILAIPFPAIAPTSLELILGNYTNVTSALGACIAAGGTVTLMKHARHQSRLAEERHRITAEMHQLLHLVHPEHAAALKRDGLDPDEPPTPGATH